MSIFVTGDTHGDFSRLAEGSFQELEGLHKSDCVLICGDFGGVWNGSSAEQAALDRLDGRPFTTLFVDGNHENYDLLARFPLSDWHGGQVRAIRPSVLHLQRGQVYEIEGKRFFTMGGASSYDVEDGILEPGSPTFREDCQCLRAMHARFRVNHRTWWRQELPSPAEYRTAREALDRAGWQVDYIVTHCAPSSIQKALFGDRPPDPLTDFLEEVRERCGFECWFFGHYHDDGVIGKNFVLLYEQLIELN